MPHLIFCFFNLSFPSFRLKCYSSSRLFLRSSPASTFKTQTLNIVLQMFHNHTDLTGHNWLQNKHNSAAVQCFSLTSCMPNTTIRKRNARPPISQNILHPFALIRKYSHWQRIRLLSGIENGNFRATSIPYQTVMFKPYNFVTFDFKPKQ